MKRNESAARVVRALRGGQMTIPREFRESLAIAEQSLLEVRLQDGELRVRPLRVATEVEGSPWLKELYDLFAPVRDELADLPEHEINSLIDEAVRDVRREHAAYGP